MSSSSSEEEEEEDEEEDEDEEVDGHAGSSSPSSPLEDTLSNSSESLESLDSEDDKDPSVSVSVSVSTSSRPTAGNGIDVTSFLRLTLLVDTLLSLSDRARFLDATVIAIGVVTVRARSGWAMDEGDERGVRFGCAMQ
ncbi:MAG: hypothetical protein M1840_000783 [Geoglossum simile]|nr:MAG: hypothetical protein M1840_000783 [Geoglossum simile]